MRRYGGVKHKSCWSRVEVGNKVCRLTQARANVSDRAGNMHQRTNDDSLVDHVCTFSTIEIKVVDARR